MCLARSAHGLVPNHSIFQGPFPVTLEYEPRPTPDNYRHFPDGVDLPPTLSVWNVDTADYTTDKSLQPGTVASGYGFADSPDAEVIANGINSKGPGAVALGRQASFFLWGFACEPSRMTAAGRQAFLNSICYIQRFDHAPLLVQRKASGREWSLQRVLKDPAALGQAKADLEFVRADGRKHVVDDDCRALGIGNRDPRLLEHCIAAFERGEDVERSQRLLRRYTDQQFATAPLWRAWLTAHREALFFSDVGGYRFFVRPRDEGQLAVQAPAPSTSDEQPVAVSMPVLAAAARPGDVLTIAVRVTHAAGWHSYAAVPDGSPYRTTTLQLDLPAGWVPVGRWSVPATVPLSEEPRVQTVEGDAVFLQRVRVAANAAAGQATLQVRVGYLACDAQHCLPPAEATAQCSIDVKPGS